MNNEQLPVKLVKDALLQAKSITILSHLNPDADTLGTALGIYALLMQDKTKKVEVVNASNALPNYLDFLPNFNKIKHKMDYADSFVISCDCGSIDRLGFDLAGREILNIDHHQSNTRYGDINVVIPTYASASQVAYALFKNIYEIDTQAATCFYTALLSDTRYFTTSSVNTEVFSVAQELVGMGVRADEVAQNFTQRRSLASIRILAKALDTLRLHHDAKIATMYASKDDIRHTGALVADMEGIVDYGRSLATVEIAIFAMELDAATVRISLRSKTVDISKVAVAFGGGGHRVAAGFTLKQCELQRSIDTILEKINHIGLLDNEK